MMFTNRYIEVVRVRGYHVTFSVTQFAFGLALLCGDEPGTWVLIIGPLVISPLVVSPGTPK